MYIKPFYKISDINIVNNRYKCKYCDAKMGVPPQVKFVVCYKCGNLIFKSKKEEFKYYTNQKLKELKSK